MAILTVYEFGVLRKKDDIRVKMTTKVKLFLLILGIAIIIAAIPFFWFLYHPTRDLRTYFLDVGQGDAVLVRAPDGQNILIDGGPDDSVIRELGKVLPWWDRQIDLMVLTHPHDDHVGGLASVLKRYRVKKILYTGVSHTGPAYSDWLDLVRRKNISAIIIDRPQIVDLKGDCRLQILWPTENLAGRAADNLNNTSIVIKLIYGQTKFLLMGDAETDVEKKLLESGIDLKADILKIGHHGSDNASSEEFLQAVLPRTAVIEVGKDNDFGHPSLRILKKLERIGAQVFRTDTDGTVTLLSDGNTIKQR
ncbi:MBL fold metallo-hydrolase [Candidatus Falkowbacteria bacterium]|nr:MBL fold metallo-hydrolase [Candidatus Falkowbacteria bacterium]